MLEVVLGVLSTVADILAPTPATRWFWAVLFLMLVVLVIAPTTKSSVM